MSTSEIKNALLNGQILGNEAAGWCTLCNPSAKVYCILREDGDIFFSNIDGLARRVSKYMKYGI